VALLLLLSLRSSRCSQPLTEAELSDLEANTIALTSFLSELNPLEADPLSNPQAQGYLRNVRAGLERIPATLEAAIDQGSGDSFTTRVFAIEESGRRAIGEYDMFVTLLG
jgi:hypothetical protein